MKVGDLVTPGRDEPVGVVMWIPSDPHRHEFKILWCDGSKTWENWSTVILYRHEVSNEDR